MRKVTTMSTKQKLLCLVQIRALLTLLSLGHFPANDVNVSRNQSLDIYHYGTDLRRMCTLLYFTFQLSCQMDLDWLAQWAGSFLCQHPWPPAAGLHWTRLAWKQQCALEKAHNEHELK